MGASTSSGVLHRALLGLGLAAAICPCAARAQDDQTSPCPPGRAAIAVSTETRELWLCRRGVPEARYSVAIGRGGVGKRRVGDLRTPLGRYALGEPRASNRYGTFIPIAYPTVQQATRGFTGTAVGIHGPPRGMDATTYPTTEVDWTEGCIATGTDGEVDEIAAFVRQRRPVLVIR